MSSFDCGVIHATLNFLSRVSRRRSRGQGVGMESIHPLGARQRKRRPFLQKKIVQGRTSFAPKTCFFFFSSLHPYSCLLRVRGWLAWSQSLIPVLLTTPATSFNNPSRFDPARNESKAFDIQPPRQSANQPYSSVLFLFPVVADLGHFLLLSWCLDVLPLISPRALWSR